MRLTTLNLFGYDDWGTRYAPLINFYKKTAPDIAFFQEVVYLPEVALRNQVQTLNLALNYPYEVSTVSRLQVGVDYPVFREGLAVLSRHPIVRSETLVLKQAKGDEHNRIIQLLDIDVKETLTLFAHVHFSITDITDFATAQLEETIQILRSREEQRIIIGDFNLSFLEDSRALWGDEYIATTDTPYLSYPSMNKRTDYALIPKSFTLGKVNIGDDSLSDHTPLTIEVTSSAQ